MMTIEEILHRDYVKNNVDHPVPWSQIVPSFSKYVAMGGNFFRTENVIIIYKDDPMMNLRKPNKSVEFHCLNGGSGKDLTLAVNQFLKSASADYNRAVTYYDNPKISELSKYSEYPTSISKIDGGRDMTYMMEFDLGK